MKILSTFGYHRAEWIKPFEALSSGYQVEYLHFISPKDEPNCFTDKKIWYWNSFNSYSELLDTIQPDVIFFMSIDSAVVIGLNLEAKRRNIRSIVLQHGFYGIISDYLRIKQLSKGKTASAISSGTEALKTKSYLSSLSAVNKLRILTTLALKVMERRFNDKVLRSKWKDSARVADFYLCYSYRNSLLYRELDKIKPEQFVYLGSPEFELLKEIPESPPHDGYLLLIDQPFAGNKYGSTPIGIEATKEFYLKLHRYACSIGKKLVIKLHPESASYTWLPEVPGIQYIRTGTDNADLISRSSVCFGMNSSLLMMAMMIRPTVAFRPFEHSFFTYLEKIGYPVLDYYTFTTEQISEVVERDYSQSLHLFEQDYYPFKGSALTFNERLEAFLDNLPSKK